MGFFKSYFSDLQVTLLIICFSFLFIASIFHVYRKHTLALILLLIGAAACFSFGALLDPFLNLWDERFHALVAKNLMNDMLKPMLFHEPLLEFSYRDWNMDSIWLHKQPLFLWQIAICFKIFGVSEFTLRLPDVILGTFLVYTNYRIAQILANKHVAFITAVFTITSHYFISLIAGRQMSDHNDFIFLCYVSFSLWSLLEYYHTKKKYWIYFIGIFSGCAILNKWLIGLLVYLVWGIYKLTVKEFSIKKNIDLLKALVTSIVVFAPWQLFILYQYPELAKQEYAHNSKHLTEVVEGHIGTIWFHFEQFFNLYGLIAAFFVLPGMYFLYKKGRYPKLVASLLGAVAFVYLFFSLVATKMPSFTIIVSSVILVALAYATYLLIEQTKKLKKILFVLGLLALAIIRLDVETLQLKHTMWRESNYYTYALSYNKDVFVNLDLPEEAVLFNVKDYYVDAMFYTGVTAYWFIPNKEQYETVKSKNKVIVILDAHKVELPDYLQNDPTVIKINESIHTN